MEIIQIRGEKNPWNWKNFKSKQDLLNVEVFNHSTLPRVGTNFTLLKDNNTRILEIKEINSKEDTEKKTISTKKKLTRNSR